MKKLIKIMTICLAMFLIVGCGPKVEVGSAQVGKIKTKAGFQDGYRETSRFRLDSCMLPGQVCDTLILLDVGDREFNETMTLVMPKDRLKLEFTLGGTISIREDGYNEIYKNISAREVGKYTDLIDSSKVYNTYAKKIINSEAREFISQYSIDEVMSNREQIGAQLSEHLKEVVNNQTPFHLRYTGLSEINYPDVITDAQENAAKRREAIEQERAELEVSRVKLERELEETRLQRKISVEKAESEAEVNQIIGDSITDRYVTYRQLEALEQFAKSDNTKLIPFGMIDSMSSQVAVGNELSK